MLRPVLVPEIIQKKLFLEPETYVRTDNRDREKIFGTATILKSGSIQTDLLDAGQNQNARSREIIDIQQSRSRGETVPVLMDTSQSCLPKSLEVDRIIYSP